jgi:hypothetical protein
MEFVFDMLQDVVLWGVVIVGVVALIAGYAYPPTRPYVKKYGIPLGVLLLVVLGYVIFRRRPGNKIDAAIDEGRGIGDENMGLLDVVIDRANEERAAADVELARRRLKSEEERGAVDLELATIKTVDNSLERRKALIKLAEKHA